MATGLTQLHSIVTRGRGIGVDDSKRVPQYRKKTKELTPRGATVVFQGVPIRSDLKRVSVSYTIHREVAYLFGNAGTAAFFEYGDLGSYDGSMTVTARC